MYIFTAILIAAGLLHFTAFPERYKVSKVIAYAYFFAGLGQITLGLFFLDVSNFVVYLFISLIMNSAFLIFWFLSRSSLFKKISIPPEPITFSVVLRKLLEFVSVILFFV